MLRNRQRELAYLESRYNCPGTEFAVLHSRRRVGKTTLVYEWSRNKSSLFFFAARLPGEALLREFGQKVAAALGQTGEAQNVLHRHCHYVNKWRFVFPGFWLG